MFYLTFLHSKHYNYFIYICIALYSSKTFIPVIRELQFFFLESWHWHLCSILSCVLCLNWRYSNEHGGWHHCCFLSLCQDQKKIWRCKGWTWLLILSWGPWSITQLGSWQIKDMMRNTGADAVWGHQDTTQVQDKEGAHVTSSTWLKQETLWESCGRSGCKHRRGQALGVGVLHWTQCGGPTRVWSTEGSW